MTSRSRLESYHPVLHHGESGLEKEGQKRAYHHPPRVRFYPLRLCTLKRRSKSIRHRPPRWRILPPEVIHIIVGLLKHDKATLRACSLATRDFSQPALSCIGRHITVNYVPRIKLCARLLTANSAFQHVRSLDIGVTSKSSSPKDYLTEQLTILDIFSQRQTLTRLWLSKIPFPSFESSQRENIQNIVAALGSTVNDLGLYECSFLSRSDVISFICAFPHCDSLYVRDCVMGGGESAGDMFSGLPKHKLSLEALELTSTSPGRVDASVSPIIDVSSLIEDADLDVSKLSVLICNVESDKQAHSVVTATSSSPVQHLELSCAEPGGFQGKWETLVLYSLLRVFFFLLKRSSTLCLKSGPWNT